MSLPFKRIGVLGAGAMGRGIVQLFAQAGFKVVLHDTQPAAIEAAIKYLEQTLDRLVEKGRLEASRKPEIMRGIEAADSIQGFADCDLVIEAILEQLDVKREVFRELEKVVSAGAVLVSNTSSLSITAIAAACQRPSRVAGYHFFNPVPLMKVVEVVQAARTDTSAIQRLVELTRLAGHTPVICNDTPGFIVNHAGRGFGTESLKALGEGVADVATIDRILREQVDFNGMGFKLGPFELMDLTGLDVSHPVMESIYHQYYEEPRFRPSVIGAQRVSAGLFGRKTREGFYRYDGSEQTADETGPQAPAGLRVWVAPSSQRQAVRALVDGLGGTLDDGSVPDPGSLIVVTPIGIDATSAAKNLDASRVIALDTIFPFGLRSCKRRSLMSTPATSRETQDAAHGLFAADGARVSMLRDSAGFISQRVVAMIISIATEIAQQRIASPQDIDSAVRIGLGYPVGPLTMGDMIGPARVLEILDGMHRCSDDPRYRAGPWLRRRASLGMSLLIAD
ncbi:MAG: 3-hydroxyacyl-CoA dehydrogenase [Quisquiliibacterium sp.]